MSRLWSHCCAVSLSEPFNYGTDSDDEGLETIVYKPVGSESDTNEDVKFLVFNRV